MLWRRIPRSFLLVMTAAGLAGACSDDNGTGPTNSPLSGLVQSEERDSLGNTPPPGQGTPAPGYFRGRVLGQATPQPGEVVDTLATAPRIAGVRVAAFPKLGDGPSTPELGPELAAVTTDVDGVFQLPELPHGEYVVTFTPPAGSEYQGVWVTAFAHSTSHEYPWWVVLPEK